MQDSSQTEVLASFALAHSLGLDGQQRADSR